MGSDAADVAGKNQRAPAAPSQGRRSRCAPLVSLVRQTGISNQLRGMIGTGCRVKGLPTSSAVLAAEPGMPFRRAVIALLTITWVSILNVGGIGSHGFTRSICGRSRIDRAAENPLRTSVGR